MTTTAEILDRLAAEWRATKGWEVEVRDRAFREARAILQDPRRRDLGWFVSAFNDPEKWAFALKVMPYNEPTLRPLFEQALERFQRNGDPYVLSVLRDHGLG